MRISPPGFLVALLMVAIGFFVFGFGAGALWAVTAHAVRDPAVDPFRVEGRHVA